MTRNITMPVPYFFIHSRAYLRLKSVVLTRLVFLRLYFNPGLKTGAIMNPFQRDSWPRFARTSFL